MTIVGYESPGDDVSEREATDRETTNWLEIDLGVRTPHGRGISRVACMQTWDAACLADWLDTPSRRRFGVLGIAFPEPHLALHASVLPTQHVRLHVWFVLERPGEWQMDDAPTAESGDPYHGAMSSKVPRAALHLAAESCAPSCGASPCVAQIPSDGSYRFS